MCQTRPNWPLHSHKLANEIRVHAILSQLKGVAWLDNGVEESGWAQGRASVVPSSWGCPLWLEGPGIGPKETVNHRQPARTSQYLVGQQPSRCEGRTALCY